MLKKILAILAMLYAAAAFAAVDVNTAKASELDSVKGIGPAMSQRILDERKKGKFKNWDDLISRVKGLGETSAGKLSAEGLTVNGETYKMAKAEAKADKKEAKAEAKADKKEAKAEAKADKKEAKAEAKADKKEAKAEAKADKKEAKAEMKADAGKPAASAKK